MRVGGARFLLKRLIGRGENSEVWLARDVRGVRDVALKFLPPAFLSDTNLIERFQEQCRRNFLLEHPQIVSTYELVSDHDSAAISMEFVDGWSLATLKVDKLCRCYSVDEIDPWIRQLGEALEYAHTKFGLVHGDLKPANLLLSAREGIKVSDFGFAALLRSESSRRGLARGGPGSIGFLSPQQVMGGTPATPDDIYSLGATIFDLLTGTPPFYQGEVIAQICGLKPPGMMQRLKELDIQSDAIPAAWEDTVARCLAKNPDARPQSIGEVLQLLQRTELSAPAETAVEVESTKAAATEESTADRPVAPAPGRVRPARFVGVLVLMVAVGLAAVFGWKYRGKLSATANLHPTSTISGGSPDKNFAAGSGADDSIRCLTLQPDGKILVGGLFSEVNSISSRRIARLNADGTVDAGFVSSLPGRVYAIAVQPDGKLVVAGDSMFPGRPRVHVTRLNPDGSRDGDWGVDARLNAAVRSLAIQPDGRVIVGGNFVTLPGKEVHRLMRLTADGRPDDTFDIGAGASAPVWSVAIQPDGKILAVGAFDRFNGESAGRLVRLNPDGSRDAGFKAQPGANADVLTVSLQKDGKILIGGKFTTVDGVPRPRAARLNPDGSLDTDFHPGDDLDQPVQCFAVQPDGKIILGGGFEKIQGEDRHGLARLNPDGSLDRSFDAGGSVSNYLWGVAIQPDGKILAAGSFAGGRDGKILRLLP